MKTIQKYTVAFDGQLLRRGFWLYVWRIKSSKGLRLYVGRTGDSSSRYAASPFHRIGQHLDARPNAKGNALMRQMLDDGLDPTRCKFELVALGPLFPEQKSLASHRPIRDIVGGMEGALATLFRERGYIVLGTHGKGTPPAPALMRKVRSVLAVAFPARLPRRHRPRSTMRPE